MGVLFGLDVLQRHLAGVMRATNYRPHHHRSRQQQNAQHSSMEGRIAQQYPQQAQRGAGGAESEVEALAGMGGVAEKDQQGGSHNGVDVARDLNNLARLLQDTNRLVEAELLMRRMVEIFLKFKRDTGHEHPNYRAGTENYAALLQQMGYPDQQVHAKLHELAAQYGLSLDE